MSMNRVIPRLRRPLLTALLTLSVVGAGAAAASPARAVAAARAYSMPLTSGGAFTATLAGFFTFIGCPSGANCTLVLTGRGPATYLGNTRDTTVISLAGLSLPCAPVSGESVLTSTATTGAAVTANITGSLCIRIPPIKGLTFQLNYTITGGRGAFSGASGSGTITGAVNFHRAYQDVWKGTLTYP